MNIEALNNAIQESRETNRVVRLVWPHRAMDLAEDHLATCEGYMDSARLDQALDAWGEDWRIELVMGDITNW